MTLATYSKFTGFELLCTVCKLTSYIGITAFLQQHESTRQEWQDLWEILETKSVFEKLNNSYIKHYCLPEHLVIDLQAV
jgi:hypothetical protein